MDARERRVSGPADVMATIWPVVGFGALFWTLDAFIDTFVFHESGFVASMLPSDPVCLRMRLVGVSIVSMFAVYTQFVLAKQKRTNETLRQSEDRFHAIFDNSPLGITLIDAGRRSFIGTNSVFLVMIGYTWEELSRMTVSEISHPDDEQVSARLYGEAVEAGWDHFKMEKRYIRKDGSVLFGNLTLSIIRGKDGSPEYLSATVEDITERKKAETGVREMNARLHALVQAIPDMVYFKDAAGRHLLVNKAMEDQTGMEQDRIIGRTIEDLLSPGGAAYCRKSDEDAMRSEVPLHFEEQFTDLNGEVKFFDTVKVSIRDSLGHVVGLLGISRDITDRKKTEMELRKYKDHLEHLVKERTREIERLNVQLLQSQKMEAVGQLAGGIAHDFNNILSGMMGHIALIRMKMGGNELLMAYMNHMHELSSRAAHLTQSLLAFSRKQVIDPRPLNINSVIDGFQKILSRLIGEDIEVAVALCAEDLIVAADKGQLEQVLMNLATNARDAMPRGGRLTFSTEAKEISGRSAEDHVFCKEGRYAVVSVSDTGAGMDEDTRKHVFEPFFTTKEVGKGSGLGLAIVYGIVEQHNGFINVRSRPAEGTTFRIFLPVSPGSAHDELGSEYDTLPSGTETILLIEDDESVRWATRAILEEFGYAVVEAPDGEAGVRVFREYGGTIHMVISDVVMPKGSGREALEEIRNIRPDVKALFISGYPADIISTKGSIDEGIHFIAKPLDPARFLQKIREVLSS